MQVLGLDVDCRIVPRGTSPRGKKRYSLSNLRNFFRTTTLMCLCDSTVTEARGVLCESHTNTETGPLVTAPPKTSSQSPFKRKGPARARLCQKRDAEAPENSAPVVFKRARSTVDGFAEKPVLSQRVDVSNLLRSSGLKNREELFRELSALRNMLALPPKKRRACHSV